MGAVAYLGFLAPGAKVSLGTPTQAVSGSIDAKSESGVKRRRKWTPAPHLVVYVDPSQNFP